MGFGLASFALDGFCACGWLELLDGGFDKARCDLATTGLFNGAFPRDLSLVGGKPNQGPDLRFLLRLGWVTNGHQMGKDLGRRDQAVVFLRILGFWVLGCVHRYWMFEF